MRSFRCRICLIIAGASIAYLFSGCSKAPDAELAAARAAVQAAKNAEADKYMVNNFQILQKALEATEAEITNQNNTLVISRKYKRAKELCEKTTKLANDIAREVPKVKADMVTQLTYNLGVVQGMLKETAADIKKAPRTINKAVIAELKADLSTAESAATHAADEFKAGNMLSASDDLAKVQSLIKKITGTLKPKNDEDI